MSKWTVDSEHSIVQFKVKHLGVSWALGQVSELTGEVEFDKQTPESAAINVTIPVSKIDTGIAARDGHLRSGDFFHTEQFPIARFQSKTVKKIDATNLVVVGDLTIKDITKEVEVAVELTGQISRPSMKTGAMEDVIGFHGTAEIDRTDFGLNWNVDLPGNQVLVGHQVKIEITIEAIKQN
jgi:polyisoprenoid-binding protein YceI